MMATATKEDPALIIQSAAPLDTLKNRGKEIKELAEKYSGSPNKEALLVALQKMASDITIAVVSLQDALDKAKKEEEKK